MAANIIPPRRVIERMAPPSLIWMMLGFSVGFALMVAAIILARHGYQRWGFSERELASIDQLPMAITYLGTGIVGFCLAFPCLLSFLLRPLFPLRDRPSGAADCRPFSAIHPGA